MTLSKITFWFGLFLILDHTRAYYEPTAADFCQLIGDIEYMPMLLDDTCQNYLYCYLNDKNQIDGVLLQCLGSQVFSPQYKRCVFSSQYRCITFRQQNIFQLLAWIHQEKAGA